VTIHPDLNACEDDGWDGIVLARILECAKCHAIDEYTVAPTTRVRLLASAFAAAQKDRGAKELPSWGGVIVGVSRLWDGTDLRRPSQGLARLREITRERPDSGEAWRRLGNFAERYDRREEAKTAWETAIRVDAHEFEAAYSLTKLHYEARDVVAGFPFLAMTILRLPGAPLETDRRLSAALDVVDWLGFTLNCTTDPLALSAMWPAGRGRAGEVVVRASCVDLRTIEDPEHLATFLARTDIVVSLSHELPTENPTALAVLLGGRASNEPQTPYVRPAARVGRNEPCSCGSGKKFKKCCLT
jgi:hypothetical protein